MRRLLLAVAAAGLVLSLMPPAAEATPPLVTDPKGDALPIGAGFDIVSANLYTTGTTKKIGKKNVYTPKYLWATQTMAGPPSTLRGTTMTFHADISACGNGSIDWEYHPGNVILNDSSVLVVGCGTTTAGVTEESVAAEFQVVGNTLMWKLRLSDIGNKDLPLGTTFSGFYVSSDVNDPVTNIFGTSLLSPDSDIDYAKSSASYTLR